MTIDKNYIISAHNKSLSVQCWDNQPTVGLLRGRVRITLNAIQNFDRTRIAHSACRFELVLLCRRAAVGERGQHARVRPQLRLERCAGALNLAIVPQFVYIARMCARDA